MSVVDTAISRLQSLALQCTSVAIKRAPDYPVENVEPFPFAITHLVGGSLWVNSYNTVQLMPTVQVDFHFSRTNLKQAYQHIDAIAVEYAQRLGGDPTLNGAIDTIQINRDNPVNFSVEPQVWDTIATQMLRFEINFKDLTTAQAST